jgi:NitT/TauT family transport system substrate-binding protein
MKGKLNDYSNSKLFNVAREKSSKEREKLIKEKPEQVQALVKTWFEIRDFMEKNPQKADEIMAKRAGISLQELKLYKEGTKFFTLAENIEAFSPGNTMKNMPFAATKMADFMKNIGFIKKVPDLTKILDPQFVKALNTNKT